MREPQKKKIYYEEAFMSCLVQIEKHHIIQYKSYIFWVWNYYTFIYLFFSWKPEKYCLKFNIVEKKCRTELNLKAWKYESIESAGIIEEWKCLLLPYMSIYLSTYLCIRTHTHTHTTHTHTHTYIYIYIYSCIYIYIYTHICIHIQTQFYIYIYIYINIFHYMHMCTHTHIYIYIYIYIYINVNKTHTHTHTHTHIYIHIYIYMCVCVCVCVCVWVNRVSIPASGI